MEQLAALAEAVGTASDLTGVFRSLRIFVESSVPYSGLFVSMYDRENQQRVCVYAGGMDEDEDISQLPPMPMNDSPNSLAIKRCSTWSSPARAGSAYPTSTAGSYSASGLSASTTTPERL